MPTLKKKKKRLDVKNYFYNQTITNVQFGLLCVWQFENKFLLSWNLIFCGLILTALYIYECKISCFSIYISSNNACLYNVIKSGVDFI